MKNLTRIIFVALLTVTLSGKTAAAAEKEEAKNVSSSGHALLPKTGEAGAPEYLYIGLFLCGAVIYLVRHTKRKEEILE